MDPKGSSIEIHSKSVSNKALVAYHDFLLRYSNSKKRIYGFVEGKDDPSFYKGFIENHLPSDWSIELRIAGNKNQVLEIHSYIEWDRFPKKQIAFFVDRDLSDFLEDHRKQNNDSNIYVTDGYSIENNIVNRKTCSRVLTEIFNLSYLSHDQIDLLLNLFDSELKKFLDKMVHIMAWIITWKRCNKKPCLDNVDMRKIFYFVNGKLKINPIYKRKADICSFIHEKCKLSVERPRGVLGVEKEFRKISSHSVLIRGKYVLWFFVEFCKSVHRDIKNIFSSISSTPKINVSLALSNAVCHIGPRARIPDSLEKFLKANYCLYISEFDKASK